MFPEQKVLMKSARHSGSGRLTKWPNGHSRSAKQKSAKLLPYKNPALAIDKRVRDLLSRMTLEEKAAQMMCIWQKKAEMLLDADGNFDLEKAKGNFKKGHGIGQVGRPSDAGNFIVGGFTLPLVAKFALGHDKQHGWQMTMTLWAVLCLVLFAITFLTTRERIRPDPTQKSSVSEDFAGLLKNNPWKIMVFMTLIHFAILSFRGGALYNYYHHYDDKAAMFDFLQGFGLTAPPGAPAGGGILEFIGYIVHGDKADLTNSNVADVFNSIINMVGTATTIIVILLSPSLANRFGKKAIAVVGFALSALNAFAFYLLGPSNVTGMLLLTILGAIVYAPTIPLIWAIFADVADYSEWKTGRRFTGMVFATIGFALKSGLALGSASFLMILQMFFNYDTKLPAAPDVVAGYRACTGIAVGIMFAICTVLLVAYQLNKRLTIQMAEELAQRRKKFAPETQLATAS